MSVLNTVSNIKIPYPSEGVIRTAQLDDTVAPTNSVQLAVNMNFDRVGALETRPGVTSYADSLAEQINNFGTLRNAIVPAGYEFMTQVGSTNDLADNFHNPSAVKVNDNKIAIFWTDEDQHGQCQNFSIDEDTGAMGALGTPTEFEAISNSSNKAILIVTSGMVLNAWNSSAPFGVNGGYVQTFNVVGDTVTLNSTALKFDSSQAQHMSLATIDSSHVICFYTSSSDDGIGTVFAIDLSTGAVTEPGAPLTFESAVNSYNSCVGLGDGVHFVNFWGIPGKAQTFSVNLSTWAITALSTPLAFSTNGRFNNAMFVNATHVVNAYVGNTARYEAQCFAINASTFAITTVGTSVFINASGGNDLAGVGFGDGAHFAVFYSETIGTGFVQMLATDPSTFNMSLVGSRLGGYPFADSDSIVPLLISSNKVAIVYENPNNFEGEGVMFESFGAVVNGKWLYAGHGTTVSNTPNGTWTTRRSGLSAVSKPRFAQFLNYIWMVNGSSQIGGDPVATSNGGAFGNDLVPSGFPAGDFIHAGFEGRVWVANQVLGVVYYTDIVQFTPPSIYTLSYNPEVNFISELTPQTGQSITGLYRVPRALLVFTEDTITRIYGATSVDAYPAYNVGTFSQESIIETKTGIFFHHSSGFYQFDYGSQPVEISRRIIDFVKAIPRANYADIKGVYDNFDNVEWAVGQVIVEGVVFSNCVVRYTISTQVWTIYDYPSNVITAMISYDDGAALNHLMGTAAGLTGAMDVGDTDFGAEFYYEFIDRWRAYTDMYFQTKSASGFNVYNENAAGANLSYQPQKSGPNEWLPIGTITEDANALLPNSDTQDFNVMRLRLAGNTSGARIVIHGIEIVSLTVKGQETN